MTANGWTQILFFFIAILAVTVPLGAFMYRVMEGQSHFLRRPLGWLERLVCRACGVDGAEQSWPVYALIQAGWFACALGVSALVWGQHAGTLASLGVSRARTAMELWRCSVSVARRIWEARLDALAPSLGAHLQEGAP